MISLKNDQINFFKKHGWVKSSLGLNSSEIAEYRNATLNLVKKAKEINYPYKRIYHDYLLDFNLAAIECPLNKSICDTRLYDLFRKIKLGNSVKNLMGWRETFCSLIRLFCMGNYNYEGDWHQDSTKENQGIQICIYLKDESGFRIIKKDKENEIFNSFFGRDRQPLFTSLPLKIPDEYFSSISAKAGDVLFFDPTLLHQGFCEKSRLQFHMRFKDVTTFDPYEVTDNDKDIFDFKMIKSYEINLDIKNKKLNFPQQKQRALLYRCFNSINYYIPFLNFHRYLKLKKIHKENGLRFDLFANTFYQK